MARMYLAKLMEERGVTVEQVAQLIEHRAPTVARWLNGEGRGFSVWHIINIYEALFSDMTVKEFFRTISPNNKPYMEDDADEGNDHDEQHDHA